MPLANHPNILGRAATASSAGIGDVDGPSSSTDNAIARFDGTTGKRIQNSVLIVADTTGALSGFTTGVGITLHGGGTITGASGALTLTGATTVTGTLSGSSSVNSVTGVHSATVTGTGGASYGGIAPITLYVKSVTVLTAGSPADIVTITIPAGITRWAMFYDGTLGTVMGGTLWAETAAGTLAGAEFEVWSAAGATGTNLSDGNTGPAVVGGRALKSSAGESFMGVTSSTIYIRQTTNSANAGTVSFYITIYPLP